MIPTVIVLSVACIIAAKGTSIMGNFFHVQQSPESSLMSGTVGTSLLQRSFHLCSLEGECNYVIQDIRTGEFNIREKEEDLPAEKKYFRIWKKTKPGKNNKGKSIPTDVVFTFSIFPSSSFCCCCLFY